MTNTLNTPLLIRAFNGEQLTRPPVWLMRQAGRYLHEYQQLRSKHTFLETCKNPELAVEVSMQPIRILDVDAAIIFSDILVPLEPMGIKIDFNPGPKIFNPIKTPEDVDKLLVKDCHTQVRYVAEALALLRENLNQNFGPDKATIGFAGTPWTLACYAIDQGPFKHFQGTTVFAKKHPEAMHRLLSKLTEVVSDYLIDQVELGGAQMIQLFDSWGGILTAEDYQEFSLPYCAKIFSRLKSTTCRSMYYLNNCHHLLQLAFEAGADGYSIDSRVPLDSVLDAANNKFVVQGNLEATELFLPTNELIKKTRQMLNQVPKASRYIANLGHGILPTTPRENVIAFVNTVKEGWVK